MIQKELNQYNNKQKQFIKNLHPDLIHYRPGTMCDFKELGLDCRGRYPYVKSLKEINSQWIDQGHQYYAELPEKGAQILAKIPGSLRKPDALKLYEMAYYSKGPILELGMYQGLSTSILATATRNSKRNNLIFTVDLSPTACELCHQHLLENGLREQVAIIQGDASVYVERVSLLDFEFGFVFVDHSHSYEAVRSVSVNLNAIVKKGGFVLYHDYQDQRNISDQTPDYGVAQGVMDGLNPSDFEFVGCFGCCSLWRRI